MNPLQRIRYERGFTLIDLQKASGVSQSSISEIETGKRKARGFTLAKLARALDVPLDTFLELLDDSGPEKGRKGQKARRQNTDATATEKEQQADNQSSLLMLIPAFPILA